jgi:predicted PurR-regulated permease PerM
LGGFLFLAIPPAVNQSVAFAQQVPNYIGTLEEQQGPIRGFLREYNLEGQLDTAIENAKEQADELAAQIANTFVKGVGSLLNGVVTVLFILVLTFLMLVEGPGWVSRAFGLYDDDEKRKHHKELISRMNRVVSAYVNGQVLIAAIAAMGALVALLVLAAFFNVPYSLALPLAGVIFIASMIPMIGATLGTILVTFVLLFSDVTAALIFLAYFVVYQQIENNMVQPAVQSRSVELTALSVLVAVLVGVYLLGILGALLAIPIAGCIRVLVNDHIEHRRKARESQRTPIGKVKKALSK